ncbi:DUF2199 domain-containing protein [Aquipuribacter sp. SD81]|uniref:DUF2199 domain-containing protein n=1 Tax=Aquipuribacter sp. SD81 TaxID=3127703 RepID=UPI003FA540C9
MLRAEDSAFLRVLLPVALDDGSTVTYGVWVQVSVEDQHRARSVWHAPECADRRLEGQLANNVPPGGVLDAPLTVVVRDPDEVRPDDLVRACVLGPACPGDRRRRHRRRAPPPRGRLRVDRRGQRTGHAWRGGSR